MTDANVISIAITLFAIAAGSLFNNVRISYTATSTNKRIDDLREVVNSQTNRLDRLDQKLDRIAETLSAF